MTQTSFLLLTLVALFNATANLLLKRGSNLIGANIKTVNNGLLAALNPYTIGGLALLGLGFFVFIYVLTKVNVSIAYPIISLAYILVAIGAHFFLGELLTPIKIAGIVIIIIGVSMLSFSAK